MKQITLKTIVLIDGIEHVLSSCDYSESISEHEQIAEETFSNEDILSFIKEDNFLD